VSPYSKYQDLLDIPYVDGDQDCYGLVRKYYLKNYELSLRNYARPIDFADTFDLISANFIREGFEIKDISLDHLEIGDGLLLTLNNRKYVNHVGVFVGNSYVLHHLYKRSSSIDALTQVWKNRITSVVRHPDVTELNRTIAKPINFLDLINGPR
jgi:cell wall-associated NlpC family hydrolase